MKKDGIDVNSATRLATRQKDSRSAWDDAIQAAMEASAACGHLWRGLPWALPLGMVLMPPEMFQAVQHWLATHSLAQIQAAAHLALFDVSSALLFLVVVSVFWKWVRMRTERGMKKKYKEILIREKLGRTQ